MQTEETDILVVGGGPTGLIAAREASRKGAAVAVLEEDAEIGLPCHCAGLVSIKGLENLGVPSEGSFVQNKVRGARFFSPSGLSFTVEREEAVASVVDRRLFDKFLAQQAEEAGARIKLGFKVQGVERSGTELAVRGREASGRAKILIDAEGVSSEILKTIGLNPLDRTCLLTGLQLDLQGVDVDPDYVQFHAGQRIAPGFFAWVIPLSRHSARVGLACKGMNPREHLERFIKDRLGDQRLLELAATRSGRIVTCGPMEKTFDDNFLVVGDAAGQAKPTTGGGVVLGGICASIAGEVAAEAVDCGELSGTFLQRYESLWKERFGNEFRTMLLARKVMDSLSDKAIDRLFKVVIDGNLQNLLSAEGDMDFQRGVLLKLLKSKEVLKLLPSFLKFWVPF